MIDDQNVNIIYGDQFEGFFDSIDAVIDEIEGHERPSDALRKSFPNNECFDWQIQEWRQIHLLHIIGVKVVV